MSQHFSEPVPTSVSRPLVLTLLVAMILAVFGSAAWAQAAEPPYSWTLKSGLFTVESDETFRILVTEVAKSEKGLGVVVRFYDERCAVLDELTHLILPGSPMVAELTNSSAGRMMIRFEMDFVSEDSGVVPVSTVESDRPGALAAVQRFSCAGPMIRDDAELACTGDGECPPPPTKPQFQCPELALF